MMLHGQFSRWLGNSLFAKTGKTKRETDRFKLRKGYNQIVRAVTAVVHERLEDRTMLTTAGVVYTVEPALQYAGMDAQATQITLTPGFGDSAGLVQLTAPSNLAPSILAAGFEVETDQGWTFNNLTVQVLPASDLPSFGVPNTNLVGSQLFAVLQWSGFSALGYPWEWRVTSSNGGTSGGSSGGCSGGCSGGSSG